MTMDSEGTAQSSTTNKSAVMDSEGLGRDILMPDPVASLRRDSNLNQA